MPKAVQLLATSSLLTTNLVTARRGGCELKDVTDRGLGDVLQRFPSKKSLMAGDHHVWQREQAGKNIIRNDLEREVLEEQFGFLFVNIEPEVTDFPGLYRVNDGLSIDQAAPTCIYQHYALLHVRDGLLVNEMSGRWQQRSVQRDNVGFLYQLLEVNIAQAEISAGRVRFRIVPE